MIKLIEVIPTRKDDFSLREIYVNPDHVVFLREDITIKIKLEEQKIKFPEGLDDRQLFTRIQIHNGTTGTEFIVIGAPHVIESKLKSNKKEMLHG